MPPRAHQDESPDEALRGAIEAALRTRSPWAFPPVLEALYEERRGRARQLRLRRALGVFGLLFLATLILDRLNAPGLEHLALSSRLATTALCLAAAFAVPYLRPAWLETLVVCAPVVAAFLVTEVMGQLAPHAVSDRYIMAAPILVAAILATVQMRYATAVTICVVVCVLLPAITPVLPNAVALNQHWDFLVFTTGAVCTALYLARRNEISRRRNFLYSLRHEFAAQELNLLNAKLLQLSSTDMLTGLANRRQLEADMVRVWNDRRGVNVGVVLVDVDHFKSFNDTAGHAAGDECLRKVAAVLAATLRKAMDRAARYGGEEFVVLLPGIAAAELPIVGERLRRAVEELGLPHPGQGNRPVTISVGLAFSAAAGRTQSPEDVLREADGALYAAKSAGRNRVVMAALQKT